MVGRATGQEVKTAVGPVARMRCSRCGQRFWLRPGRLIAHDIRQGCVCVPCDGRLEAVQPTDDEVDAFDRAEASGRLSW